jgi:hypothetical protein
LSLSLDGVIDAHVPFLVNAFLCHGMGKGRSAGEQLRRCLCIREHSLRLAQLIVEAPTFRLRSVHQTPGIKKLGGTAGADYSRQDIAGTHVGAG